MSDLIDRQAAIDAPVKMVSEGIEWIPVYHLKSLPPAQPEIIRCRDCIHAHDHDCPVNWGRTEDDYCSWAER